jgi:hypothetical protein
MAGAGYRTWTAGEVVTASNVQSYLQDQTVGVYAGTAARSSAILSPSEGQVSYRTDDDIVEVYDGTAWQPIAPPDTSGLIHIETESFSAVSGVAFTQKFTADFTNYFCTINVFASTTAAFTCRLRNATTDQNAGNYTRQGLNATSAGLGHFLDTAQTSFSFGNLNTETHSFTLYIFQPKSNTPTMFQSNRISANNASPIISQVSGNFSTNYDADGINFLLGSGNMTGEISLFGLRNA